MNKRFLDGLLGPFPMGTPPVREGFYAVELKGTDAQFEMWHWGGGIWTDSDDGLGDTMAPDQASGWWGKFPPPPPAEEPAASDGLDL